MYKFDARNSAIPNFWKREMSKLFCQLIGKMIYYTTVVLLVEPKFKKVFSMFFLYFHVMNWKIQHHNNEIEEFRLKMLILVKIDVKYASCNDMQC